MGIYSNWDKLVFKKKPVWYFLIEVFERFQFVCGEFAIILGPQEDFSVDFEDFLALGNFKVRWTISKSLLPAGFETDSDSAWCLSKKSFFDLLINFSMKSLIHTETWFSKRKNFSFKSSGRNVLERKYRNNLNLMDKIYHRKVRHRSLIIKRLRFYFGKTQLGIIKDLDLSLREERS